MKLGISKTITEHLPGKFIEERKKLTPAFKEARLQSKKTAWRVENGHYALYIDNQRAPLWTNQACSVD